MAMLAARERVSSAGGQLLIAALGFLATLVPEPKETQAMRESVSQIKTRLSRCVETDANGNTKLSLALPDATALDSLATSLAHFLNP